MRNIAKYACNKWIALGLIVAAIVAEALPSAAALSLGQTVTTISNPDGSVTTVTWTPPAATGPTTGPTTNPTPPVVVVPAVTPTAAAYVAGIGEFLDGLGLPGINGQSYGSTLWLLSFPKDANGFIIPPIPANAIYCSTAATPGHLASDCGDFNSAVSACAANGSYAIVLRDGGTYPRAFWDQNLEVQAGTAAHPIIVTRSGPNGFLDHSRARPICQGGFGLNDSRAGHPASSYIIVDGLDFQGTNPPTQQQCLGFLDSNSGAPSSYVLVEDCRFEHFVTGTSMQSGVAYPLEHLIFRRCVWDHCYAAFYGEYHSHVQDFLLLDCVLANCGWDAVNAPKSDPAGREHDSYVAINPSTETNDPQHRVIDTIFATPDAEGCEGDCGGLFDTVLYLGCPIGGYGGVYQTIFNNVVVDGDNLEFDPLTTCGTNSGGVYKVTQSGKPGDALSLGPCGVAGALTGYERGWGLYFDCAPTGTMENTLFIDKPDGVNSGPAIQVCLQDNAKGLPSTSSNVKFNNVKIHNWYQWPNVTSGAGPCPVSVSGTTSTLTATINYLNCVFPGVNGTSGVSGIEPNYVDPARTVSTYAASIGITGGAPAFLTAAENNWSGNWNPALTAQAVIDWIGAGFEAKQ
ncbi:MAG: hypothetical protein ABSB42_23290 [Tepidisphaeraceae bacterium]|jgi:hypothetical protein